MGRPSRFRIRMPNIHLPGDVPDRPTAKALPKAANAITSIELAILFSGFERNSTRDAPALGSIAATTKPRIAERMMPKTRVSRRRAQYRRHGCGFLSAHGGPVVGLADNPLGGG